MSPHFIVGETKAQDIEGQDNNLIAEQCQDSKMDLTLWLCPSLFCPECGQRTTVISVEMTVACSSPMVT